VPARFQAAIFDVDGVLVDSPHQKAWRESLRELMEGGMERHPRPDDLVARGAYAPRLPGEDVG
jgi:beta-phosphoglucomutase-like phosphatase (HAD superfamily)